MKRKRFMQCNLLSINIFLEDFSNDNVVVHVRFELTIFVTTISRRFLPPERDYHENRQKNVRFACGGTSLYIYCSASLLHRKNGNTELRACPEVGQTSVSATIVKSIIIYGSTNKALEFPTLCLLISLYIISMIRLSFTI